jgi:hypothetical protein
MLLSVAAFTVHTRIECFQQKLHGSKTGPLKKKSTYFCSTDGSTILFLWIGTVMIQVYALKPLSQELRRPTEDFLAQ